MCTPALFTVRDEARVLAKVHGDHLQLLWQRKLGKS